MSRRTKRVKDLSLKWVKMPERGSAEWLSLMGAIMAGFRLMLPSLAIACPDKRKFRPSTRYFLEHISLKRERGSTYVDALLASDTYGLGVVFYDLQPYVLPWVKIAKAKLSKEFAHYIREASMRRSQRFTVTGDLAAPYLSIRDKGVYGDIYILTHAAWTEQSTKSWRGKSTWARYYWSREIEIDSKRPRLTDNKLATSLGIYLRRGVERTQNTGGIYAVCKDRDGRTCVGRSTGIAYPVPKTWILDNQLEWRSEAIFLKRTPHGWGKKQDLIDHPELQVYPVF